MSWTQQLTDFIARPTPLNPVNRHLARAAVEDTLAVALAGWFEPVSTKVRRLYAGGSQPLINKSEAAPTAEHAALIHATAGHALDFDDVHLASTSHPSVVIVPALLAAANDFPSTRSRLLHAYAVGVAINVALGESMGFEHYRRGWHATSTIGAVAAAAAVAHLLDLDETNIRSALALAVAQAGGLQRNFGSMAKPLQAGFASAAGLRATLLAKAGVTGDQDIFSRGGFLDVYAGDGATSAAPNIDLSSVCVKLYPCCYGAHRMIAAALQLQAAGLALDQQRFEVVAPAGQLQPLRIVSPASGLEAKFCARYIVATALLQGSISSSDFTDAAAQRREHRALMERVTVVGSPDSPNDTLEAGEVVLNEIINDSRQRSIRVQAYPGSGRAPATDAQRDAKIADCLDVYQRSGGERLTLADFRALVSRLC